MRQIEDRGNETGKNVAILLLQAHKHDVYLRDVPSYNPRLSQCTPYILLQLFGIPPDSTNYPDDRGYPPMSPARHLFRWRKSLYCDALSEPPSDSF